MSLPLAAGHVLVRLHDGGPRVADAVLDALERVFPTHTGRGRSRIANVWEDPPTVTAEGSRSVAQPVPGDASASPAPVPKASSSQAFDVGTTVTPYGPAPLAGPTTAVLLGLPRDVEMMARTLAILFRVREEARGEQRPYLELRLRIDPPGDQPSNTTGPGRGGG